MSMSCKFCQHRCCDLYLEKRKLLLLIRLCISSCTLYLVNCLIWFVSLTKFLSCFVLSVFILYTYVCVCVCVGPAAQSVRRLATAWTVRGSNPSGDEIFRTCPDRPWGPPSLLYNGYRVFPGGKERPGRDADPSPLLVPWSWKVRAIPLLPLRAVRPVQSLSACTRVHFTSTFYLLRTYVCTYRHYAVVCISACF